MNLSTKLVLSFVVVGVAPLLALGFYSYQSTADSLLGSAGDRLEDAAITDGDIIERNLFERFGDVQAFAANPMATGAPAQQQQIVDLLTVNYGVYDLMLIVGTDGKIETANGVDGFGGQLDSGSLVGRDVSAEEWFQAAVSGDVPAGTHYTDADYSPYVTEIYGEEMLGLPFTAPIYGPSGDLVGVWHNVASFERVVSDVMDSRRQTFADQGLTTIETQVIRSDGLVLDDADSDVVMELNLAGAGLGAAVAATGEPGESGSLVETHLRRGVDQVNGYAVSDGALGFDGYNWGILVRQDADEAASYIRQIRNSIAIFALVAIVVVAGVGLLLARSLAGPLKRNAGLLADVADGDLSVRFDVRSNDEVGQMSGALNTALSGIGSTLARVDQSAHDLSASSSDLTGLSNEMSRAASDTSDQANEVAAAAEEISVTSGTVARAMDQMSASVREISDSTADAARMSSEAVDVSLTTRERMQALESSASDIGNVVNVITSIAEQTDLLALNATIEAARVGEAGKGFAVVANEVKALASQTSSATDEIQAKIEAIQTDAVGAVQAIAEISGLIERVNEASTTIAGAVEEQSATTMEVTASLQAVTEGTTSISETIASVADSARVATDGASRTKGSAAHLAELATELNQVLARFNLSQDRAASSPAQGGVGHPGAPRTGHPEPSQRATMEHGAPQAGPRPAPRSAAAVPAALGTSEPPMTPGSEGRLEELSDDLLSAGWK